MNETTTFSQAAIKWALTDPGVSSVCISMRTFEHVDEYLPASGKTLTNEDEKLLAGYARAVDHEFCRIGCTTCQDRCPNRVSVGDIMRFGMYYENYGEEKKALLEYAALEDERRAGVCADCDALCEGACPHGLPIRDRLLKYDELLRI